MLIYSYLQNEDNHLLMQVCNLVTNILCTPSLQHLMSNKSILKLLIDKVLDIFNQVRLRDSVSDCEQAYETLMHCVADAHASKIVTEVP